MIVRDDYRRTGENGAGNARIDIVTTWKGALPAVEDWLLPPTGVYAYRIVAIVETGRSNTPIQLTVIRMWRDQIPADGTFHHWEWKQRRW